MKKQRDVIIKDLTKIYRGKGLNDEQLRARLPAVIRTTKPLNPENIGGDIVALEALIVLWTIIFIVIETLPNGFWTRCKKRITLSNYYESKGIYGKISKDLD